MKNKEIAKLLVEAAEALSPAQESAHAKLSPTGLAALHELFASWSPDTLKEFHDVLEKWHSGEGYMKTEDASFTKRTPLDVFEAKHPKEMADYGAIINANVSTQPLYRCVLFDQADEIVEELVTTNQFIIDDLWYALDIQNQMSFRRETISQEMFVDYTVPCVVRKFSSWTSKPMVAYKLAHEGGMYQIGKGSVILRTGSTPFVAHTFDGAKALEKFCEKDPELSKTCKPFMQTWSWQVEYVVRTEGHTVPCDGVLVTAVEGEEGYYETLKRVAGIQDEDDDE